MTAEAEALLRRGCRQRTASYELARLRAYVQGVREWRRVWKAMVHE